MGTHDIARILASEIQLDSRGDGGVNQDFLRIKSGSPAWDAAKNCILTLKGICQRKIVVEMGADDCDGA